MHAHTHRFRGGFVPIKTQLKCMNKATNEQLRHGFGILSIKVATIKSRSSRDATTRSQAWSLFIKCRETFTLQRAVYFSRLLPCMAARDENENDAAPRPSIGVSTNDWEIATRLYSVHWLIVKKSQGGKHKSSDRERESSAHTSVFDWKLLRRTQLRERVIRALIAINETATETTWSKRFFASKKLDNRGRASSTGVALA